MKLLYLGEGTNDKKHVLGIHYHPEMLTEEDLSSGILVENIPEPESLQGKSSIMYVNPQTLEVIYEYFDNPLTQEEKIVQLEQQISDLNIAMAAIMGV